MTKSMRYGAWAVTMAVALGGAGWLLRARPSGALHPGAAPPTPAASTIASGPAVAKARAAIPASFNSGNLALVREVVAQRGDASAKALLAELERERSHYDALAHEYDETNQRYQAEFLKNAPAEQLRSDGARLDELMTQLWDASSAIYRVSTRLSDLIVADALAENQRPSSMKVIP